MSTDEDLREEYADAEIWQERRPTEEGFQAWRARRESQQQHSHWNGGKCWTPSSCAAREALAKLRAELQAKHPEDVEAWGPLVEAVAGAIPEPLA